MSSPRRPSPNYSPGAATWAQQENINALSGITVPPIPKKCSVTLWAISRRSLTAPWLHGSTFLFHKGLHATAVLVRLIKCRYYSGPVFMGRRLVCRQAASVFLKDCPSVFIEQSITVYKLCNKSPSPPWIRVPVLSAFC